MSSRMLAPIRLAPFALTAALASLAATSSTAQEAHRPGLVQLSVVDRDSGETKQVWHHDGRSFVAGDSGRRYSLRIANESAERVMVVVSVDGVNVVTGETADFQQSGYVLRPYESYDISGWRKSQSNIAAFRFAPLSQSYAARTGRPGDVGVIGMAVFRERLPKLVPMPMPRPYEERNRAQSDAAPPSAPPSSGAQGDYASREASPRRSDKLGTAHGEIERDRVEFTHFEKASKRPATVRIVEYDSTRNLIAAGVIPRYLGRPRPFPGNPETAGFVPDPPAPRRY